MEKNWFIMKPEDKKSYIWEVRAKKVIEKLIPVARKKEIVTE
jgi:hypothetical protein